jgi:hypothetical protein
MFKSKLLLSLAAGGSVVLGSLLFAPHAVSSSGQPGTRSFEEAAPAMTRRAGPRSEALAEARAEEDVSAAKAILVTTSDGTCPRARRKLWIDGEGWVVRRVAACH